MVSTMMISLVVTKSFCQDKKTEGFFKFRKNKKIEEVYQYDTITVVEDDWYEMDQAYLDSIALEEQFVLAPDTVTVVETKEPDQFMLSYGVPIKINDQLSVDSIWLSLHDYYHTWSSTKINPYNLDGVKLKDTLTLPLVYDNPDLSWSMPLDEMTVTSKFGLRKWKWHYGDDIRLKVGDSVRSVFDGIVRVAHYDRYGYGHYILIRHYNGLETLYGHLSKRLVKIGDVVKAGELIGLGGSTGRSTGPHLHFEVRYQGNAIQPITMFDFENMSLINEQFVVNPETFAYLKEARKVRYHRVRSGDTLSHISYRYGVSLSKICRLNGISRSSVLRIGQRIRIT